MKKVLFLLLAAMFAMSLVACSDDDVQGQEINSYKLVFTPANMNASYLWNAKKEGTPVWLTTPTDLAADNYRVYALAGFATGVPSNSTNYVGQMWGTSIIELTKVGSGASQTWEYEVARAAIDFSTWTGDTTLLSTKIVLVAESAVAAFKASPGSGNFYAVPGGSPHMRWAVAGIGFTPVSPYANDAWDGGGTCDGAGMTNAGFPAGVATGYVMPYITIVGQTKSIAIPFFVTGSSPANGGTVSTNGTISVSLSKALASSTVVGGKLGAGVSFALTNVTAGTSVVNTGTEFNAALSTDGKTLTITPAGLVNGNNYSFGINGIAAADGTVIAAGQLPISRTFNVVAPRLITITWVGDTHDVGPLWLHSWNQVGFDPPSWPGIAMTETGPGTGIFTATFTASSTAPTFIVNNKGTGGANNWQSADLNCALGINATASYDEFSAAWTIP